MEIITKNIRLVSGPYFGDVDDYDDRDKVYQDFTFDGEYFTDRCAAFLGMSWNFNNAKEACKLKCVHKLKMLKIEGLLK